MQIRGFNFKDCLEYDYYVHRECESSGCNDEGICRCGSIEDAHVVSVNVSQMVNAIVDANFDNSLASIRNSKINSVLSNITTEIDRYTIDRILRINKVFDKSNWEIQICGGYYGQEIDDIILDDYCAQKIESELNQAFSIMDMKNRIEYLLTLEYGHILTELQDKDYKVISIKRDSVIFGSDTQHQKVATEDLRHYSSKNYHLIRGLVVSKGNKYRIIDGYHRCFASEDRIIKVLLNY